MSPATRLALARLQLVWAAHHAPWLLPTKED